MRISAAFLTSGEGKGLGGALLANGGKSTPRNTSANE